MTPLKCLLTLGVVGAHALRRGPHRPITSFCWGNVTLLGHTILSTGSVKGALVVKKHQTGSWDWRQHELDFGTMMNYHHAGIQPEEVQQFIEEQKPVVFLTAGVLGVLELSDAARSTLEGAGYRLLDLAADNKEGKSIGGNVFRDHCTAENLVRANMSPKASQAMGTISKLVKEGTPVALRTYTGDALIMFNELHAQFPAMEFVGLIHTSC
mmetsp:Transcript_10724/g.25234  ORF Transcript_10724/g.25234 Transcript_10724/m.25234 type:complete len:211 (+) Transcript_10724:43-675(+)